MGSTTRALGIPDEEIGSYCKKYPEEIQYIMSALNIFISFPYSPSVGGPSTFMANLKKYMDDNNIAYATTNEHAQGIFFPIQFDESVIKEIKKRNGKVIQRLDGVYYPSKHGSRYVELNKQLKKIYLEYADHVIFQSEYSKKQCFEMLGVKDESTYTVIYNGVHKDIFYPEINRDLERPLNFITTGNFRNIDMLEPVIRALDMIQTRFEFKLHVVGPVLNPELNAFLDRSYVINHGSKKNIDVASLLRNSEVFIYSHLNPPCPNSVLEAISSGIPVVGFDSGVMGELCWFSKDLLAYVSEDIFQQYNDFIPERLVEKLELCFNNYEHYRELALKHAPLYPFEECGAKYVQVFNAVLAKGHGIGTGHSAGGNGGSWTRATMINRIMNLIRRNLFSRLSDESFKNFMFDEIERRAALHDPADALRLLFDIDNRLYAVEGRASIRYGDGLHTKHRHIKYHDFFIQNIEPGSRVLDIGCGNGALAADIADNVNRSFVYAIDILEENIRKAESEYHRSNIRYICGNVLSDLPDEEFNVIILSNVLEHIEKRIEFLSSLNDRYKPDKMLIRVPCFDRDWRVPLKREIGIDYRLDETHYIEYLHDEFVREIHSAGLCIESARVTWGEIWAVIKSGKE